jgi:UPF0716 family protein affecting phage T7 exclusion
VSWSETLFGYAIAAFLVAMALVMGWRQVRQLRRLRTQALPDEEMRWERRKAWRRLVSAGLLLLMGGLLVTILSVYEPAAMRWADQRDQLGQADRPPMTADEETFLRVWIGSWIALLLLLLAVVALAGVDLWATRQYGVKQFRKLQADRRAMIERQAIRLRQERNGHD